MERRERKTFVPPPWEPQQTPRPADDDRTAEVERPQQTRETPRSGEPPVMVPGVEEGRAETSAEVPASGVDEKRVAAMLVQLRLEEPSPTKETSTVGLVAGVVTFAIGLVMAVWGFASVGSVVRAGGSMAGYFGAGVILMFALFFFGMGGWLLVRGLRQRGDI